MLRALTLAAALAACPLAAAAQSPSPSTGRGADAAPPALPHPEHVLVDDLGADGAWASAPSYKAAVRAGRLTFVPFLGSDAPRNQPLHLELDRVVVSGEEIAFGEGAPALEGTSLRLDRGAVRERLDCRPEGAELVVEVDLPSSAPAGPVVVRYAAGGEAEPRAAAGGGLRFVGPLGDVIVGAASAVLPGGDLVPIETALVAGGFEYRVPAEVVRASGDRLVIDPLISRGTLVGISGRIDQDVDLACDDSVGYYTVVQRAFSATDRDVLVYTSPLQVSFNASFVAAIDLSSEDWTQPAIAARRPTNDWLVVATQEVAGFRRVQARWGNAAGTSIGLPFAIIGGSSESFDPDVGVEATGQFLLKRWGVVLSSTIGAATGSNVCFAVVGGSGTGVDRLFPPFRVTNESEGAAHPAIAPYNGPSGVSEDLPFPIAYSRNGTIGDSVRVRCMTRDNNIVGTFDSSFAGNVRSIAVSAFGDPEPGLGGDRAFLLAYESTSLIPGSASEVYTVACTRTETVGPRVSMGSLTDLGAGLPRSAPSVASSGRHWTIAYEEGSSIVPGTLIRAVTGSLAGDRLGLVERELPVHATPFEMGSSPSVVGQRGAGLTGQDARRSLLAFSNGTVTRGAHLVAAADLAAGSQYCDAERNSTGRSAWLRAEGSTSTTSAKRFVLQDAAPNQFTLLLTASSTNFVPSINGSDGNLCLGPDDFGRFNANTGVTTPSGGFEVLLDPSMIPQALGTTAAMVGDDWYFQSWFRDTTVGGSNLSNAVRVEFDH